MNDNLWSLIGVGAVAYLVYKYVKRHKETNTRRFKVLQGGKADTQFMPSQGPIPQAEGTTPQIAVLGWPEGNGVC